MKTKKLIKKEKAKTFYSSQKPSENESFRELIINKTCSECLNFIESHTNLYSTTSTVLATTTLFNIQKLNDVDEIINLSRINDIRYINKFFEGVNQKLPYHGKFIFCVETFNARWKRKKIGKIPLISGFYFFLEFVFMRIFPKVKILNKIYFTITRGKNRLLSKAETLGRLISCGFEIIDFKEINGIIYIASVKRSEPEFNMEPSYGPLFKMKRVGKHGKIIGVYKLRTMHPYSEYLQDYMFNKFGSKTGDKIDNDFRISKVGSILRKFWIDEIPMLINLIKGEIKLIGVRPLSESKFKQYPEEAKSLRIKSKPGLIPPYYADLPKDFKGLVESELIYLKKYHKSPFKTDLDYLVKALNNIIIKGARSL